MNHPGAIGLAREQRFIDLQPAWQNQIDEIIEGLSAPQKHVSPRFFYDEHGSALFEQITRLPEYYPTRAECRILELHGQEIADSIGSGAVIIEPGAGNCEKIRLLLDALEPSGYWPVDISGPFVEQAAAVLREEHPGLSVTAVCADFNQLGELARHLPDSSKLAFYPGSTLGNLSDEAAIALLGNLRQLIGNEGDLLLGVDLHKNERILHAAYNDSQGITAAFNLNLLDHLNRLLPADFQPRKFRHLAFYNGRQRRIEMHLQSRCEQLVTCAGERIRFARDETIHTESSRKYSLDDLDQLLGQAGLARNKSWFDPENLFGVHHCRVAP